MLEVVMRGQSCWGTFAHTPSSVSARSPKRRSTSAQVDTRASSHSARPTFHWFNETRYYWFPYRLM